MSGKPLTQAELAAVAGGVLGKDIPVQQVDDETYASVMAGAGVPEAALPIVVAIQAAIREGALDIESGDLEKLLQRPQTPLSEGISALVNVAQA